MYDVILSQVHHNHDIFTGDMLRFHSAFNMAKYPEVFYPQVCDKLME